VVLSVGNASIHESLVETITSEGSQAFTPANVSGSQARSAVRWILTNATADEAFRFRARKSNDQVLWLTSAGESTPRRAKKQDQITIEPLRPDELRRWLSGLPLRPSSSGPELGSVESLADETDRNEDTL
ncbi:unnamed protein product, partial [Hapterophycus canaliculatus]